MIYKFYINILLYNVFEICSKPMVWLGNCAWTFQSPRKKIELSTTKYHADIFRATCLRIHVYDMNESALYYIFQVGLLPEVFNIKNFGATLDISTVKQSDKLEIGWRMRPGISQHMSMGCGQVLPTLSKSSHSSLKQQLTCLFQTLLVAIDGTKHYMMIYQPNTEIQHDPYYRIYLCWGPMLKYVFVLPYPLFAPGLTAMLETESNYWYPSDQ